jgi:Macrocin-O-methyltransferase (TylF)
MKRLIRKALDRAGYVVFNTRSPHGYAQDGLFTMHSDHFRRDETFRAAYARGVQASEGIDPRMEWRVHVALRAASLAARVAGDFVECGVNAGFVSSAIMHSLDWRNSGRRFYLIDTFHGPVLSQYSQREIESGRDAVAKSALAAGAYVTDVERVRANFSEWPSALVVQGTVPDVLETLSFREVAFLHLDMNCALPERAALEFFWSRLSRGGVVLLDDYTYFGHSSQTEAIDSLAKPLGFQVLALPTGQGLIVK